VTTLVIDASAALKWLVPEESSDLAREIYGAGYRLIAPRLIVTEVANALVRKTVQGLLDRQEAAFHFRTLAIMLADLIPVDDLIEPALSNACALRHPIYDLFYLETARKLDAHLVTADRRFAAKLADTEHARYVTLLSEWQPS